MKNIFIAMWLCFVFMMSSCNEDKIDTGNSIFSQEAVQRNSLDKWLLSNYVYPYNIEVKYRMEDIESTMAHVLAPATFEKSVALSKIVKHVWLEAYDEVVGIDFMRSYVPRSIHIIGSPAYNQNGTIVLGTAEGGMKITLYNVNSMNVSSIDIDMLNQYYFRTMHHEFAHILHQTRNYDPNFERITESSYVGDNWYIYTDPETGLQSMRSDKQAWQAGFISPYSMSEAREDFVEIISGFITNTPAYWEYMLIEAGDSGAKIINEKFAIVYSYMLDTWHIDLYKLREVVLRRQNEVSKLDLRI